MKGSIEMITTTATRKLTAEYVNLKKFGEGQSAPRRVS